MHTLFTININARPNFRGRNKDNRLETVANPKRFVEGFFKVLAELVDVFRCHEGHCATSPAGSGQSSAQGKILG